MSDELRKVVGFAVAAAAVVAALALVLPRWLGSAAGPATEIITALKTAERDGLSQAVAGGRLTSRKASFARMSVSAPAGATEAVLTATLDFEGALGETTVSSLGLERVPFVWRDSEWVPQAGWVPRLGAVVSALERRRHWLEQAAPGSSFGSSGPAASDSGQGEATAAAAAAAVQQWLLVKERRYRSLAWFIRSEREEVVVTEDFERKGLLPDRPVDERGTVRLTLQEHPSGEFFFPHGLM